MTMRYINRLIYRCMAICCIRDGSHKQSPVAVIMYATRFIQAHSHSIRLQLWQQAKQRLAKDTLFLFDGNAMSLRTANKSVSIR